MSTETRKAVRADSDLPPAARLLFEEIWEMHHDCEKGCYASNEELGTRIGAAASSVRRYRRKLRNAGYLTEEKTGGRIYKIPTDVVSSDRGAVNTDRNGQNRPVNTDRSDQNCTDGAFSTDHDMSCNNPEGTGESAPAREADQDEPNSGRDGATDSVETEDLFMVLIDIWRNTPGTPPLRRHHEDVFERWVEQGVIDNPSLFREVLSSDLDSAQGRGANLDLGVLRSKLEDKKDSWAGGDGAESKYMPSPDPDLDV